MLRITLPGTQAGVPIYVNRVIVKPKAALKGEGSRTDELGC